jgi:hypothetical protein
MNNVTAMMANVLVMHLQSIEDVPIRYSHDSSSGFRRR